jgi:hypothetical protein
MKARSAAMPVVLLVLAAAAAAYAYLVDRGTVSDADRAARRRDVFPSFRVDEVARLELEHGAEQLVLERSTDGGAGSLWTMTSPRNDRADAAAVDVLLRDLERATRLRDVDERDAVGLEAPRVRGTVRVGALEYRFALGADAPLPEGAAYMKLEGEGAFVVDRALKVQLLRGADDYRDRSIVPWGASGTARIEARSASGATFALERRGPTFRVAGRGLRAARATVDRILTALADARAETFLDDAEADRATARPEVEISVIPREAATGRVQLRIGGACPGAPGDVVVVRTEPSRLSACVTRSLVDALTASEDDVVDASPLFARPDEIEELRIEPVGRAGPRVDVARRGSGWHERSPQESDLSSDESESVTALAVALADARGDDVHASAGDERVDARSRVTVVRTGGETTEVVDVGAPAADGSVLVRRADDGALLRLAREAARRFEPHPAVLRPRSPWAAGFGAASVVAVDDTCGPTPQRLELVERTWVLRAPVGLPVDAIAVADLASALARARADAWIAEADDGTFGFGRPGSCTVTVTLREGADDDAASRRLTLSFGAPGGGGFHARTGDDVAVFVAPRTLRQTLEHPVIDRARLRVDLGPGATVTVVKGDVRRSVAADAGEDSERLAGALAGLRAQCALHAGPPTREEGFDHPVLEVVALSRDRADAGAPAETRIAIGAETRVDDGDSYFARVVGVDATYAVPKPVIAAILAAM